MGSGLLRANRTAVIAGTALVAVTTAGVAIGATFALSSKHLGSARLNTPAMFARSIVMADKGGLGHQTGRLDQGDTITVVYSNPLNESTMCSGWSGTGNQSGGTVEIDGNVGAGPNGHDTLTVSNPASMTCSSGFHFGTIDMGAAGYFTSNSVFAKSPVTLTETTTQATLVISLDKLKSGGLGRVTATTVATYTPDSAITDTTGDGIGSNIAATPAVVQF